MALSGEPQVIPASVALDLAAARRHALIDVRAEGEYAQGCIPGFASAPILTDSERHRVGLAYKEQGQAAAIDLGHSLVGPFREGRLAALRQLAAGAPSGAALVSCWRGGLRSEIACRWLREAGTAVHRVEGGYKALRSELGRVLAAPPPLLVLGGLTGSGKTRLLSELPIRGKLNLEELARHRGSAFGGFDSVAQPAQSSFENAVAAALRDLAGPVLVEDEGAAIGGVYLPAPVRQALASAPVVLMEVGVEERVRSIYDEYVVAPLSVEVPADRLSQSLVGGVQKITKRLGGLLASQIERDLRAAFAAGGDVAGDLERHARWITPLLVAYYDKTYHYGFERLARKIVYRGSVEECRQWILARCV